MSDHEEDFLTKSKRLKTTTSCDSLISMHCFSADIVRYILSFVPLRLSVFLNHDEKHDADENSCPLDAHEQVLSFHHLYGYLAGDASRSLFFWPGVVQCDFTVSSKSLLFLKKLLLPCDYTYVRIDCLKMNESDLSSLSILDQISIFLPRIQTLHLEQCLTVSFTQRLIAKLHQFQSLETLSFKLDHNLNHIVSAYQLFMSQPFVTTMPRLSSLKMEVTIKIVDPVPAPFFIRPECCFISPLMTSHDKDDDFAKKFYNLLTHVIDTRIKVRTYQPALYQYCEHSGLFGAVATALLHRPSIHTLELSNMVIPEWEDMQTNVRGIEPWKHIRRLTLNKVLDYIFSKREFFLTKLPQLNEYRESTFGDEIEDYDSMCNLLQRTNVSRICFCDHIDVLPSLNNVQILFMHAPCVKELYLKYEHVFDNVSYSPESTVFHPRYDEQTSVQLQKTETMLVQAIQDCAAQNQRRIVRTLMKRKHEFGTRLFSWTIQLYLE